jgi:uncharacterized protein YkwD
MIVLLAGGLAVWLLLAFFVLCVCRAAARADENEAGRRFVRVSRAKTTASLAVAVVLPTALADEAQAACANRNVQHAEAPAVMEEALLCEIDRVRVRADAGRLKDGAELDVAATRHATDMHERRYFSHVSPGGGDLTDRVRRAGFAERGCSWRVGEVLAWGIGRRTTAARTVSAWLDSPSHRSVLLSRRYGQIGLGVQAGTPYERHNGGITVAAVLGRRDC